MSVSFGTSTTPEGPLLPSTTPPSSSSAILNSTSSSGASQGSTSQQLNNLASAIGGSSGGTTNQFSLNSATSNIPILGSGALFGIHQELTAVQAMHAFETASPSLQAQIQYQMYQSGGFYTTTTMPKLGVISPEDTAAFKKLIEVVADTQTNISQYLSNAASTGQKNGGLLTHVAPTPARETVTLTNPVTLQSDIQKAFIAALGVGATQDQVDKFVSTFQNSEIATAHQGLNQKNQQALDAYKAKYGLDQPGSIAAYALGNPSQEQTLGKAGNVVGANGLPDMNNSAYSSSQQAGMQGNAPAGLGAFMQAIKGQESTNNYTALNTQDGIHSGAYQMSDNMWNGYGGYAHAYQAPAAVQDAKAAQVMTSYYNEFGGNWALVAAAWNGGPGAAMAAAKNPAYLNTEYEFGSHTSSIANYVQSVMSNYGRYSNDPGAIALANAHVYDANSIPNVNGTNSGTGINPQGGLTVKTGAPNATDAAQTYAVSTNPEEAGATRMADAAAQIEAMMHGTATGGAAGTVAPAMP